ncbi:MAG TPA: hypothetical protein VG498_08235 [Terriglobales bacterium]|nr:hypothetical protein [Terriglobales bacterium]
MDRGDSNQSETNLEQEVRVRYIDSGGNYHEDRLHIVNLAAFILSHVKRPG